jgi:P4 family phage/plasmid primase-like protien
MAPYLSDPHRSELVEQSAIDPAVVAERGYETITRPSNADQRQRERLNSLRIPTCATKESRYFPGVLIPMFGPTGLKVSYQWKPRIPVPNRDGMPMKYASPRGLANRLDVHPRNTSTIVDPTVELWITEDVEKADSLTSRGVCVVALTGVFNWRSQHGTLGDWEGVSLKGRAVTICFDAGATTNPNVQRAMIRLGRWLLSKSVKKVWYLIVPAEHNGVAVKGADDFFAAGGTLEELKANRSGAPPNPDAAGDTYTDARLAETIADGVLADSYMWVNGLGWDGQRWATATDVEVTEAVREYALDRFAEAAGDMRDGQGPASAVDGWRQVLSAGRMRAILSLARGIAERKIDELDSDPDMINTPSGVVDLQTGELHPHDPALLMTKITRGSYRSGFAHPDWNKALESLPDAEQRWLQGRIGQAITGHTTPDGMMPILHGSGENGKSMLTTDGPVPALGDYASMASTKLFQSWKGTEHSTERAELRGKRLLIAEELTEGRSIDVTALKQIQDVGMITARYIRRDNITFRSSHSLFTTTNYVPVVSETDHGTWRRLALLKFPFTFRKPGEPLESDTDRPGDPTLKARIRDNTDNQHDAIVTWAVEGALRWYDDPPGSMAKTSRVEADTRAWQVEADRILGFWDECLMADPDACVLTTEILVAFNAWLHNNGHKEWSKETFGQKFAQHSETARHRVASIRPRQLKGLYRRKGAFSEPPARPHVYQGVRFKTEADEEEHKSGPTGPTSPDNPSRARNLREIPEGWTTWTTPGEAASANGQDGVCTVCLQPVTFAGATHANCASAARS